MALDKDAILQADDLPTEVVNIPEWGGDVIVRTMPGTERDQFEQEVMEITEGKKKAKNIRSLLCVRVLVDDEGERIFTDEDAQALGKKSSLVLDRIYDIAQRLNGVTAEDVDEMEKN